MRAIMEPGFKGHQFHRQSRFSQEAASNAKPFVQHISMDGTSGHSLKNPVAIQSVIPNIGGNFPVGDFPGTVLMDISNDPADQEFFRIRRLNLFQQFAKQFL